MKLLQGQIWQNGAEYIRIVRLERLQVEYKTMTDFVTREGARHTVTKKEFCRLIKKAQLLSPAAAEELLKGPATDKIAIVNLAVSDQ